MSIEPRIKWEGTVYLTSLGDEAYNKCGIGLESYDTSYHYEADQFAVDITIDKSSDNNKSLIKRLYNMASQSSRQGKVNPKFKIIIQEED